jgi:hypothetical protein
MKPYNSACLVLKALVTVGVVTSATVFAQSPRPYSVQPSIPSQRDLQSREWALSHIADDVNKHFKKEQVVLYSQAREDFTQMQVIDNEVMKTVFVKKVFDTKSISDSTNEINKRAARLRETLALPKYSNHAKTTKADTPIGDDAIKSTLLALDHSISVFVDNPIFAQPKVLDANAANQAGQQLDTIISLTSELKLALRKTPRVR